VGSIDKRVEALERRLVGPGAVRIVVVYEDAPREPLYSVTLKPPEDAPIPERERGGGRWGA
jgi:hypothetical protein